MKVELRSKRKFGLLFVLLSVGLLIGCSAEAENGRAVETNTEIKSEEEDTLASRTATPIEDKSDQLPLAVMDGTVDEEFYGELKRFWDDFETYNYDKPYIQKIGDMDKFSKDDKLIEEYEDKLREHDVYLESFYLSPSNDVEREVASHFNSFVMHVQNKNSYMKKYVVDLDNVYQKLAAEEFGEASISLEAMINAMEKHNMYVE